MLPFHDLDHLARPLSQQKSKFLGRTQDLKLHTKLRLITQHPHLLKINLTINIFFNVILEMSVTYYLKYSTAPWSELASLIATYRHSQLGSQHHLFLPSPASR